ncbi:MAG: type II secretion system secretin GspD [Thiotrichales bacterium]
MTWTSRLVATWLSLLCIGGTPSNAAAQDAIGSATLNLKDADIRVLIDTVSEITAKNFIVDPRVNARVTVISSKPMKANEIYEVFQSVLQVHGYATVPAGEVIKIVPDVNAKQGPVPTVSTPGAQGTDEIVTQVIQVNHVPSAQLVPILRPLIPQQGQLAAFQPSNTLLISDYAGNVKRMAEIIRRIDRPDQDDIELVKLDHAAAADVARTLNQLQRGAGPQAAAQAGGLGAPVITADERTNSILLSGDKSSRLRLRGIIAHIDTPVAIGGDTQVVFLKYAKAEDMVKILTGRGGTSTTSTTRRTTRSTTTAAQGSGDTNAPTQAPVSGSDPDRELEVQADPANNALVITAPPAVQQEVRQVIAQLDIRRAQVLLEAIIAEVSVDVANELGLQFAVNGASGDEAAPVGFTNFGGTGTSLSSLLAIAQNPTLLGNGAFLGVADLREGRTNFGLLLKALSGDAATNILSTPTLVTMDNVDAEIKVGQNVPFITGQFANAGTTTSATGIVNPFQTIERQDIGLTLKVKPQINEGDSIKLEIEQESSSLAASSAGASDLITNKRSIKTTVMAADGQVIILGGLIDDSFKDTQQKVPLLGDIPVLGRLFRYDNTQKTKQSLMVFIRPAILQDTATANAYTERKYTAFRARQLDANLQNRGLIRDSAAVIPDLDDLITQLPGPNPLIIQLPGEGG